MLKKFQIVLFYLIIFTGLSVNGQKTNAFEGDIPAFSEEKFERPEVTRPNMPDYLDDTEGPEFILPPVPPEEKDKTDLSSALSIQVEQFKLIGNTVFSSEQLADEIAPYEKRTITSDELQELRQKLTLYYVNRGYINSGVILPDQAITDGVITLLIIEGKLSRIELTGNDRLRSEYILDRLVLNEEDPLNIQTLQKKLQLLHQNILIKKLKGQLEPDVRLGRAILKVEVKETNPFELGLLYSNDRSPSVGSQNLKLHAAHRNLTGWADTLQFAYGLTKGMDEISGSYSIPINQHETSLKLFFSRSYATIIEEPFDKIDIASNSETIGLSLNYPLLKTISQEFTLGLSAERRLSESLLFGEPFSFSPDVPTGESKVTVLRFSQNWLRRSNSEIIAARSVFNFGIDALDATMNPTEPDGEFFTWLIQIQWAKRLEDMWDSQLIFRTDMQLTNDPLLPLEKFSIGGLNSVRGYRENQLIRDNGVVVSLEYRVPVVRIPLPKISKENDGFVQLAPFFDYGRAWDNDNNEATPKPLMSLGLGLRWDPSSKIHAELYWGYAIMRDMKTQDNNLQDDGIHFKVSCYY